MINFINKLKDNLKLKKIIYITICIAFGAYVFSIPSFSGRPKWNLLSYALMAILIGLTIVYLILYMKFKFDRRIIIPFIFVFDAFICTMLFTPEKYRVWITVLLMALTFVVLLYACKCINNQKLILNILLIAFFAFACYFAVIPEYRTKILKLSISMNDRLGGYFDNVNLVASYFAIGFSLALYLGLIHSNKKQYLYLIFCLPFAYLGLFTGSRAYIFLLAIIFISTAYIKFRHRKLFFLIALSGFVTLVVFLIIFIAPLRVQFEKTIYTLFGIGNPDPKNIETSAVERVLWMRYGFSMGSKHAIIGYGCDGFMVHSGVGTYAHNNYAEVLCDFGIPGLLIFYYILIYPFAMQFISGKPHSKYIIPLTFYFLVKSMFGVFYYYKDFYLLMAVCYFMTDDVLTKDLIDKLVLKYKRKECATINI